MKVKELAETLEMEPILLEEGDREITGIYVCDLLSRVMSECEAGNAWITIQTHLNVVAVAELNDAACIIVPENIAVNATTVEKAMEKKINILKSHMTAYEICWKMHELME